MQRLIKVKFDFEGFHVYKGAPDEVAFLREIHRHIFNVHATMEVYHDDREVEFIILKRFLSKFVEQRYPDKLVGSCEMVAETIYDKLKSEYGSERYVRVEVYEDNENGGIVTD